MGVLRVTLDLATGAFDRGLDAAVKKAKKVGPQMAKAFLAGTVALGVGSVKAAADAQTAFAKLETIAGKDIGKLKKQIMALPPELGSVRANAEAAYQAISAGRKPGEAIAFVAKAATAAKGGFTDVTTAVDAATTILNSYGEEAGTAEQIFDKFLKTQNLGKTTFGEIGRSIGDVAATAKDFGVPFDNLLGMIATLTASGIQTPKAITAIRAAISNLQKPTKDAADEMDALGITTEDVRKLGVVGLLEKVKERSKDTSASVSKIFGSVEAATAANALLGNLEKTREGIVSMKDVSGEAQEAADIMGRTFNERVAAVGVSLEKVLIRLGEQFLPAVERATGFVLQNMDSIEGAAQGLVSLLETATGLVAGVSQGVGTAFAVGAEAVSGRSENVASMVGVENGIGATAINTTAGIAGSTIDYLTGGIASRLAGKRAEGGPVSAGKSYLVGERGPEIMTARSNGTIIPNEGVGMAVGGDTLYGGTSPEKRLAALKARVTAIFAQGTSDGVTKGAVTGVGTKKGGGVAGTLFKGADASLRAAIVEGAKSGDVGGAIEGFAKGLGSQVFAQVKQALVSALGKKLLGGMFGGGFGGFFADGGRPPMGKVSIVGERGPEPFIPDRPGTILPTESLGGTSLTFSGDIHLGAGQPESHGQEFLRFIAKGLGEMAERGEITASARRLAKAGV